MAAEMVMDWDGILDVSALSVVGRIALTTDGTLTHILEAYAGEPVQLVKLDNEFVAAGEPVEPTLDEGERALRRTILLQGRDSGTAFVYAESIVVIDRLPPSVEHGVLETDRPIGKLLIDCRFETLRHIMAVWEEPAGAVAAHLGIASTDTLVARTYEIVAGGRPFARITEKFAKSGFAPIRKRVPDATVAAKTRSVADLAPIAGRGAA